MLPFDSEFQTGEAKITQVRLAVILANSTRLDLTEEHVMLGGFVRDTSTTVDGAFTIGAAVTGKVTVMLDNSDQSLSGYDFRGAEFTASLGGESSPDVFQLLQVGIYTVDEYTYDGSVITLTAYDNFYKFDKPCSETAVTFPITLQNLVIKACEVAGVPLANTSIPNGSYVITQEPDQWDTMTWHDVVSYCAQIGCCFARILPNGQLHFSWYNTSVFNAAQLDGGTFDTETTPYSDGGIADGGDFDYTDTDTYDGGSFDDRENVHILGSVFDLTVSTDDVLITGVTVSLDPTNNINATDDTDTYEKTLGTAGYIIRIENNPLIETTANADAVCAFLYDYLVGMRFRPLNASIPENPALEAGDVALVIDRLNNTYTCFLSHVSYTTGAATSISCDAESSMQNLKARYSEAQKTRALAQRTFEKTITDAEAAMSTIMTALATTMGLYQYTESDGQGGTIYVYGNKNTLASSNIRWKFSAGTMMVSSDYGRTWNAAISADGIAVLQEIYAVKVNADNIVAGTIRGRNIYGGTIEGVNISGSTIETVSPNGDYFARMASGSVRSYHYDSPWIREALLLDGQVYVDTSNNSSSNPLSTSMVEIKTQGIQFSHIYYYHDLSEEQDYGQIYLTDHKDIPYALEEIPNFVFTVNHNTNVCTCYMGGFDKNGIRGTGFYAPWIFGEGLTILPASKKSKIADTDYGFRELYCYETANPMYGDIGSAIIGEDGTVDVDIDVIFSECISDNAEYYVFLQNEGAGNSYISKKERTYFEISGTPGLRVAWEIKGKQYDLPNIRQEDFTQQAEQDKTQNDIDYAQEAYDSVMEYLNGGIL